MLSPHPLRLLKTILGLGLCVRLLFTPCPAADAPAVPAPETHSFTTADGKTLVAQITGFEGDVVSLKDQDGKISKAALAIFSKSDQDSIEHFVLLNAAKIGLKLFSFKVEELPPQVVNTKVGPGPTSNAYWLLSYKVTVTNATKLTLPNVKIQYIEATRSGLQTDHVVNDLTFGQIEQNVVKPGASFTFETTLKGEKIKDSKLVGLQIHVSDSSGQLLQLWATSPAMISRIYAPAPASWSGTAYNYPPISPAAEAAALKKHKYPYVYLPQPTDR